MPLDDDLKQQEEELLKEYKSLTEEIALLTAAIDTERNPLDKKGLEKDRESRYERRRQNVREREGLRYPRIREALLALNYKKQWHRFRLFGQFRLAAFLIHGPKQHEHDWVMEKLLSNYRFIAWRWIVAKLALTGNFSLPFLWANVGRQVLDATKGIPDDLDTLKAKSIDAIYDMWQTQNVCVVINLANTYPDGQDEFVRDFWECLAARAGSDLSKMEHRLFMFLLDETEPRDRLMVSFTDNPITDWEPRLVIHLDCLEKFDTGSLRDWLDSWRENDICDFGVDIDYYLKEIFLDTKGGIPELVFQNICTLCGTSWDERKREWLVRLTGNN